MAAYQPGNFGCSAAFSAIGKREVLIAGFLIAKATLGAKARSTAEPKQK